MLIKSSSREGKTCFNYFNFRGYGCTRNSCLNRTLKKVTSVLRNLTFEALRGKQSAGVLWCGREGGREGGTEGGTDGLQDHYLIWILSLFTIMDVQKTNPY